MIKFPQYKNYLQNIFVSVLICLCAGTLIYYYTATVLMHNAEESLKEIAKQGAKTVEQEISGHLEVLKTLATLERIRDPRYPLGDKLNILKTEVARGSHRRLTIIAPNGWARTSDGKSVNLADRDYFRTALHGHGSASEPLISRLDRKMVVVFAVPIVSNGKVVGALTSTDDIDLLSKITDNIRMGRYGNSFIINQHGQTIAHTDRKLVYRRDNDFKNIKSNPRLKSLVRLERLMTEGKTGAGEYEYHGVRKYLGFAPIHGTSWSLAVAAPKSQVFGDINRILFFLGLLAFSIFFTFIVMNLYNAYLHKQLIKETFTSQNAIDAANIMIIEFAPHGAIASFNKYAETKLGWSGSEIVGQKNIFDLVPLKNRGFLKDLVKDIEHQLVVHNFELPLLQRNGQEIYVLWNMNWINNELNRRTRTANIQIMGIDITERVRVERELLANHQELTALYEQLTSSNEELRSQYDELCATQEKLNTSEERYRLAREGSNDVIWDWDIAHHHIYFSNKILLLLGYAAAELSAAEQFYQIIHPDNQKQIFLSLHSHFKGLTPDFSIECRIKTKNGPYKWIYARGLAVKDKAGCATRIAGSLTDIDARKAHELHIYQLAYYDALTGFPNRTWLYENAAIYVRQSKSTGKKGLLALINMDNFQFINDTFGHFFGDRLLIAIGNRLATVVGDGNIISRHSGDQFVILMEGREDVAGLPEDAESIMNVFASSFELDDNHFYISASIGLAVFPDCGENVEELLRNADLALYRAKAKGKRTYVFYDKAMSEEILENTKLENSLRKAILNREFSLFYQPLLDVASCKITGFEALIRWNSPEYGLVASPKFIKLAEENGLIVPIGLWVLQEAASFAARLKQEGYEGYISVNLSIVQLQQNDFIQKVAEIIAQAGLPARNLKLEITESLLMESLEENIDRLAILKEKGIGIFLDDFGTGYSSLNYLQKLPIEAVKIDKSFVADLPSGETERKMIESIISLAHLLNLKVIAEGVESLEQFNYLAANDCDTIQGYLFGRPVTEAAVHALLREPSATKDAT